MLHLYEIPAIFCAVTWLNATLVSSFCSVNWKWEKNHSEFCVSHSVVVRWKLSPSLGKAVEACWVGCFWAAHTPKSPTFTVWKQTLFFLWCSNPSATVLVHRKALLVKELPWTNCEHVQTAWCFVLAAACCHCWAALLLCRWCSAVRRMGSQLPPNGQNSKAFDTYRKCHSVQAFTAVNFILDFHQRSLCSEYFSLP